MKKESLPSIQKKRLKLSSNAPYRKQSLNKNMNPSRYSLEFLQHHDSRYQQTHGQRKGSIDKVSLLKVQQQRFVFKQDRQNPEGIIKRKKNVLGISLNSIEEYYTKQIKGKVLTKDKIKQLISYLQDLNPLIHKTSKVIMEVLLRIGEIAQYSANEYIYKQNAYIKFIGILLWGQAILKYKNCKRTFSFIPGNSIGQELIFQKKDYDTQKYVTLEKGEFITKNRCKAIKNSAFLFIRQMQYDQTVRDFISWGFKNQIMKFQNILLRNYLKKKPFKSLMN